MGKRGIGAAMKVHVPGHNAVVNFPDGMDPADMKAALSKKFPARPTHDDLSGAAVTGADSLDLQEIDPKVKPAVKMTLPELVKLAMERNLEGKTVLILGDGTSYVMDPQGGDLCKMACGILRGDDSEALGYPSDREGETIDISVTKQGEIVTDLQRMKAESEAGNVAWAAEGKPEEVTAKAAEVSKSIIGANKEGE